MSASLSVAAVKIHIRVHIRLLYNSQTSKSSFSYNTIHLAGRIQKDILSNASFSRFLFLDHVTLCFYLIKSVTRKEKKRKESGLWGKEDGE